MQSASEAVEFSSTSDVNMLNTTSDLFAFLADSSSTLGADIKPDQMVKNEVENDIANDGMVTLNPTRLSAAGPLRHRRGHHDRQLSINSFTSSASSHHVHPRSPTSVDSAANNTTASSDRRTVRVGDHAFTIPLSSPVVPPQLQANMRITSTGRPSHARKVPEDHVKRPRNAFILFRSYACTNKLLPASLGITDHRQVSRIVGQLWKGLKADEKAVWEKLAFEEKERHKIMNPNYRYRPTYRKEVPPKRRRKKAAADDELEEEDRKCEVVARVLLEGREVDTDELEREVEEQKIKDLQEGRQRTSRSRSRSRSINSRVSDSDGHLSAEQQGLAILASGRPNSAPPQGNELGPGDNYSWNAPQQTLNAMSRPKRARTIAHSSSDFGSGNGNYPQLHQPSGYMGEMSRPFDAAQRFTSDLTGHLAAPSPRTAANLQHMFDETISSHQAHPQAPSAFNSMNNMSQNPFLGGYSGFKANADPSLLSPSFSRKFSLGRWEVPHHPSTQVYNTGAAPAYPYMGQVGGDHVAVGTDAYQQNITTNGTVTSTTSSLSSSDQPNYTAVAQPQGENTFDPAAVPAGYNSVPTYVYLSKEDAQNPQIVEHYLSQGFGVSYDA